MKTIWKYDIPVADCFDLMLPSGAKFLSVQVQGGNPRAWFLVDPERSKVRHGFRVYGTGWPVDDSKVVLRYLGTFQLDGGNLVFHLFEDPL